LGDNRYIRVNSDVPFGGLANSIASVDIVAAITGLDVRKTNLYKDWFRTCFLTEETKGR